ncbi:hypothetical protein [Microvirga massiliensis]|uniref:hypothetical protein n=1 Tax=Microvirga massiliensis TaxID=1033741 RepID=UPI000B03021C|nr:hypothetical protein [Microvirga massiliensis]
MKREIETEADSGTPASGRPTFLEGLRKAVHTLLGELRDPYRPELHYMRGPGPKSQAAARRSASSD